MSRNFTTNIKKTADNHQSRIVLALDLIENDGQKLINASKSFIKLLSPHIVGVKINFHLLLPLNLHDIKSIVDFAHRYELLAIADLKLNDISATNLVAGDYLWKAGFDAAIGNPFIGYDEGLAPFIEKAHSLKKGIILLAYMSHKGAKEGYGLTVIGSDGKPIQMHEVFLKRALNWGADGIVVGATRPEIISEVVKISKKRLLIFSPGVGFQGGKARDALKAGADFLIVGRTLLSSKDPVSTAIEIKSLTDLTEE
jgi:orotidine-5'-phosphate decarboxylase